MGEVYKMYWLNYLKLKSELVESRIITILTCQFTNIIN